MKRVSFISIVITLAIGCAVSKSGSLRKTVSLEMEEALLKLISQQIMTEPHDNQQNTIRTIDKYLGEGDWHVVWATPDHMETGIFVIHGIEKNLQVTAVWGGFAFEDEEAEIYAWFLNKAPGAPERLLREVVHELTTKHVRTK